MAKYVKPLVETPNGVKIDESFLPDSVLTQPNWSQNDPNAADFVKNRTHYEETAVVNEPLNITWDGNTEGLVSVPLPNWVIGEELIAYKVSNAVAASAQLDGETYKEYDNIDDTLYDNLIFAEYNQSETEDAFAILSAQGIGFIVVYKDNTTALKWEEDDSYFPEKGIYFTLRPKTGQYCASLTTTEPIEHTKTMVHKLDMKYLPEQEKEVIVGYVPYMVYGRGTIDATMGASWDELHEAILAEKPVCLRVPPFSVSNGEKQETEMTLWYSGRERDQEVLSYYGLPDDGEMYRFVGFSSRDTDNESMLVPSLSYFMYVPTFPPDERGMVTQPSPIIDPELIRANFTADVGQTIVVKEVDENGQPTEWEASDIPTTLPNPNALTINGTTYDGSTEVDMTDAVVNAVLNALPTWNGGSY